MRVQVTRAADQARDVTARATEKFGDSGLRGALDVDLPSQFDRDEVPYRPCRVKWGTSIFQRLGTLSSLAE
ncbi:hypothetical protein AB0L06_09810 [Spirillospora sp. NPDC052269]